MNFRVIQIFTEEKYVNSILDDRLQSIIIDSWKLIDYSENKIIIHILITLDDSEILIESLQAKLENKMITRIAISVIEAILPVKTSLKHAQISNKFHITPTVRKIAIEELYNTISNDASLSLNFIILIILSTLVVGLSMLQNHMVAGVAAMVIAPMFGPNLAMALGWLLGDAALLKRSIQTNLSGIVTCIFISFLLGCFWPGDFHSTDLMYRTEVGYTNIILALAAGTSAGLLLTASLSTLLVGIMISIALLPPLTTTGILLGAGLYHQALGSAIFFLINLVCVNLSANCVFILKGIHPKSWYNKKIAATAIIQYILFWFLSLVILYIAVYYYHLM